MGHVVAIFTDIVARPTQFRIVKLVRERIILQIEQKKIHEYAATFSGF
jgi:hypothetical protein